jgi:hypothetical protein
MRHFRLSFAVTLVLMALATWWDYHRGGAAGVIGVAVYLAVGWISSLLEKEEADPVTGKMISRGSIGGFCTWKCSMRRSASMA